MSSVGAATWRPALVGGRTVGVRLARRVGRSLLLALVVLALLAGAGAGYLAWEVRGFAASHAGRILPGATVGGVDVSGMTRAEALAAVDQELAAQLDRPVNLTLGDRRWATTPRELGAATDAAAAVDGALAAARAAGFLEHARMRWTDESLGYQAGVTVAHTDAGARAFVEAIAGDLALGPVDAGMTYDDDAIAFTPEEAGRGIAVGATTEAVMAALEAGDEQVEVASVALVPAVTAADFGQVLYLDQSEFSLELWDRGELIREWTVSTGTGNYPTPTGERIVDLKRYEPTWVNPDPEGWGAELPESIGPGPYNPLGLRALNWSGDDAIRFHGTSEVDSLGSAASHGCVRMHNDDVVELYDLVDVGARIISVN